MTDIHLPATVEAKFGPAMNALNDKQRGFVIAFCSMGTANATDAARAAGYQDNGTGAIKNTSSRLQHDERIQAAMLEWMQQNARSEGLVVGYHAIMQIATNPQHKDQARAALALMDRGGLPAVVERHNKHEIILTEKEKRDEIRQLAEFLGADPDRLLGGNVIDAEFEEVTGENEW